MAARLYPSSLLLVNRDPRWGVRGEVGTLFPSPPAVRGARDRGPDTAPSCNDATPRLAATRHAGFDRSPLHHDGRYTHVIGHGRRPEGEQVRVLDSSLCCIFTPEPKVGSRCCGSAGPAPI